MYAASDNTVIVKISEIFRPKMARTLKRLLFYILNLEKFTHRGHNVLKIMYSNMQSFWKTLSPPVKMPKKVKTWIISQKVAESETL